MVDARGNTGTHGLSRFRPWGRTSSKGVCEGTVLSCTGVPVVGGTSEARKGGKLPSLYYMIEASANIGAQESECVLCELC